MFREEIASLREIEGVAKMFFEAHKEDRIFAFYGKMGAGKTTFIKALCKVMDVTDNVTSPSFAIINEYSTSTDDTIFHFDFYRINSVKEAFDFGYEDYFFSGSKCFIEWPELVEELLPPDTVKAYVTEAGNGVRIIETQK